MTPIARAILATLRADGPALVCTLAARLDAPVRLLEAFLYALKAHGLVTCAFEGSPPVLTWRAAPADPLLLVHADNFSELDTHTDNFPNPPHDEGATP